MIELREKDLLNRERGLDALEVRESEVKQAVERIAAKDMEMLQTEIAAAETIQIWKDKCARKEKARSTIEAQIVERMVQDGCVVLGNGDSLVRGGGEAVHQHARVVEKALEEKMAEWIKERQSFTEEKARWKLQRDEWAEKHGEAATKTRELQLYATCLEKGINLEHRKRTKDSETVESEKRKAKRAMERLLVAEDDFLRAEGQVKELKKKSPDYKRSGELHFANPRRVLIGSLSTVCIQRSFSLPTPPPPCFLTGTTG